MHTRFLWVCTLAIVDKYLFLWVCTLAIVDKYLFLWVCTLAIVDKYLLKTDSNRKAEKSSSFHNNCMAICYSGSCEVKIVHFLAKSSFEKF